MYKKISSVIIALILMCFSVNAAYAYVCKNGDHYNDKKHQIKNEVTYFTSSNDDGFYFAVINEGSGENCGSSQITLRYLPMDGHKYETGANTKKKILICLKQKDGTYTTLDVLKVKAEWIDGGTKWRYKAAQVWN